MSTYLGRILAYDTWANAGLLDFLGGQPPETLEATAPGVYGSIGATLEHLLLAELSYHRRLVGRRHVEPEDRPARPGLPYLRGLADRSAAELAGIEGLLPDADAMIQLGDGRRGAATMLTQLVMHGCEHRAHVGTILGANGIEPPDLDSWAFGIFVHGDEWPAEWGPAPESR